MDTEITVHPFQFNIEPIPDLSVNDSMGIRVKPFQLSLTLTAVPQSLTIKANGSETFQKVLFIRITRFCLWHGMPWNGLALRG